MSILYVTIAFVIGILVGKFLNPIISAFKVFSVEANKMMAENKQKVEQTKRPDYLG